MCYQVLQYTRPIKIGTRYEYCVRFVHTLRQVQTLTARKDEQSLLALQSPPRSRRKY
jgi:hypothetical protein